MLTYSIFKDIKLTTNDIKNIDFIKRYFQQYGIKYEVSINGNEFILINIIRDNETSIGNHTISIYLKKRKNINLPSVNEEIDQAFINTIIFYIQGKNNEKFTVDFIFSELKYCNEPEDLTWELNTKKGVTLALNCLSQLFGMSFRTIRLVNDDISFGSLLKYTIIQDEYYEKLECYNWDEHSFNFKDLNITTENLMQLTSLNNRVYNYSKNNNCKVFSLSSYDLIKCKEADRFWLTMKNATNKYEGRLIEQFETFSEAEANSFVQKVEFESEALNIFHQLSDEGLLKAAIKIYSELLIYFFQKYRISENRYRTKDLVAEALVNKTINEYSFKVIIEIIMDITEGELLEDYYYNNLQRKNIYLIKMNPLYRNLKLETQNGILIIEYTKESIEKTTWSEQGSINSMVKAILNFIFLYLNNMYGYNSDDSNTIQLAEYNKVITSLNSIKYFGSDNKIQSYGVIKCAIHEMRYEIDINGQIKLDIGKADCNDIYNELSQKLSMYSILEVEYD